MSDRDIDDVLNKAGEPGRNVDPALLDRIAKSVGQSLSPVRPLPPPWILATGAALICAIVAVAGGALFGPHGIQKMNAVEIALIFSVLGIFVWIAAMSSVAEVIPGSPRRISPWLLLICGCAALAAVFGALFHDYRTERFLSQGMTCLGAGLIQALAAFIAVWLLLRRGFAVNPVAAGFAKGMLAGLAGVTMLELHCVNFEFPHVAIWHIAVVPISGALGILSGYRARSVVREGRNG